MKHLISTLLLFFIFSAILIFGCSLPSDPNPSGDKFNGYITFSDTNIIRSSTGYYAVSLYANNTNPFSQPPIRTDSLHLFINGDLYRASFQMSGLSEGNYFVAATWIRYPQSGSNTPIILGTLGCDTSRSCSTHTSLVFPNFSGEQQYITCWSDTTKRLN